MLTELYSGTRAMDSTEWSLTTNTSGPDADTTPGKFRLTLDVSDMAGTDSMQIRVYEKSRSGDTQRVLDEYVLTGPQGQGIWQSPDYWLMHGWDMTIDMLVGGANINWSIRQDRNEMEVTAGEPGQGAPGVSISRYLKLDYLYKAFRNKWTADGTTMKLFADDTTTVDHKSTISDDGTTATKGEVASGP